MFNLESVVNYCGSQSALAEKVNAWHRLNGRTVRISQQNISYWLKTGAIPEIHCIGIAYASDWKESPHLINPDIYPHPEDGLPEEMRLLLRAAA
jgi:hypothetical protein